MNLTHHSVAHRNSSHLQYENGTVTTNITFSFLSSNRIKLHTRDAQMWLTRVCVRADDHEQSCSPNHHPEVPAERGEVDGDNQGRVRCLNIGKEGESRLLFSPGLISEPCHYQSSGLF